MNVEIKYEREKFSPIVCLWDRWKLLDIRGKPWIYWTGNMRMTDSLWDGLRANLTLTSPLLNMLMNWRARNDHLIIPRNIWHQNGDK